MKYGWLLRGLCWAATHAVGWGATILGMFLFLAAVFDMVLGNGPFHVVGWLKLLGGTAFALLGVVLIATASEGMRRTSQAPIDPCITDLPDT